MTLICKEAREKAKIKKNFEDEKQEMKDFLIDNKICLVCGCDKILIKTKGRSLPVCQILECETCGYSTEMMCEF